VSTASSLNTAPTVRTTIKGTGYLQHDAAWGLNGILSPASLGTTENDWNPTSNGTAAVFRVTPNASNTTITGIVPVDTAGRLLLITNIHASATLSLAHDSGSSSAANRIYCPNSTTYTLAANESAWLWYDPTSSRWRVVAV
jgi:hypothetical protein